MYEWGVVSCQLPADVTGSGLDEEGVVTRCVVNSP